MRLLMLAAHRDEVAQVSITVSEPVAVYLTNRTRKEIVQLEEQGKIKVAIRGDNELLPEHLEFRCHDVNGTELQFLPPELSPPKDRSARM
jgi:Ribonuclease G/E